MRSNPFRPADWRWLRVQGVLESTQPRPTRRRDDAVGFRWIRDAIRFKVEYDVAVADHTGARKLELAERRPALFWAYYLWNQEHPSKHAVEAYLLSRQTDFEIGFRCGVPPEVIEAYEALFFNVREKINHTEYILHCVLGPDLQRALSDTTSPLIWKLYGYFCGPHFLAGIISKFPNPVWCQTPDGMSAAIQDDAISTLKLKAALAAKTVQVNQSTQLALMEQFTKFVEVERSTETQGRSQDQIMEHINAMLTSLPFRVDSRDPRNPDAIVDGGPTDAYDQGGVELTYEETMRVSVHQKIRDSELLKKLSFPKTLTTQRDLESPQLLGAPDEKA